MTQPARLSDKGLARLRAVEDSRGVVAALALDQRSALRKLFGKAMKMEPEDVPAEKLLQFKQAVSRILTPHASAILLDTEYGLPAAQVRARDTGLLLAYEITGYDKSVQGRFPRLLDGWSVRIAAWLPLARGTRPSRRTRTGVHRERKG